MCIESYNTQNIATINGAENENFEIDIKEHLVNVNKCALEENHENGPSTSQNTPVLEHGSKVMSTDANVIKGIIQHSTNSFEKQYIQNVSKNYKLLTKSHPFLQTTVGLGMMVGRAMENKKRSCSSGSSLANLSSKNEHDFICCSDVDYYEDTNCINYESEFLYQTKVTDML